MARPKPKAEVVEFVVERLKAGHSAQAIVDDLQSLGITVSRTSVYRWKAAAEIRPGVWR